MQPAPIATRAKAHVSLDYLRGAKNRAPSATAGRRSSTKNPVVGLFQQDLQFDGALQIEARLSHNLHAIAIQCAAHESLTSAELLDAQCLLA